METPRLQQRGSVPDKDSLLGLYHRLHKEHLPDFLPLETALPPELQVASRDKYRIVMTMILSPVKDDIGLDVCLGELFRKYPTFGSMKGLRKEHIKRLLGKKTEGGIGLGLQDPDGSGNGARLWNFLRYYFGPWNETITEGNVELLGKELGFRAKSVRLLQAYYLGKRDVLPLDRPGFRFLQSCFPQAYDNIDYARTDIEAKLRGETGISLIDFHELLRFRGQAEGKEHDEKALDRIIVGWNAWRLLCSDKRDNIDYVWIRQFLVKSEVLARKLATFFESIRS